MLDDDYEEIRISKEWISAKPRDMNSIPSYSGDKRVLTNLINGENFTTKSENMWMIPFMKSKSHLLHVKFPDKRRVTGWPNCYGVYFIRVKNLEL